MTDSTAGRLLVASPAIADGIFDQSVIFMLHHDPFGALGVIINRPSELAIEDLLPRWSDLLFEPSVIFEGGPVEPAGFIGVAQVSGEFLSELVTPIGPSNLATVDLEGDPALASVGMDRLRIFRGYAGWSPGQLDGELSNGGWFNVDADAGDLWSADPTTLYQRVLRRQTGDLRFFANAPQDPTVN